MRNLFSILLNTLKRIFLSGLLLWLPLIATYFVIKFLVDLLNISLTFLPRHYQPDQLFGTHIPGIGLIVSILILLISGFFAANIFGRHLVGLGERVLERIPLVRSIYKAFKQVSNALLSDTSQSFRKAALIEYPKSGCHTIAFITAENIIKPNTNEEMISVYVPTTPNPTSGFFLMLDKKHVQELDLPIDEAFKFVISLGVVSPAMFHKAIPNTDT